MKQNLKKYAMSISLATVAMATSARMAFAAAGDGITIGDTELAQGFAIDFGTIITGLLQIVMAIAALLVFLYLIWGAITWITSGGDKGKTEEARNRITAAVIGLIVLAAAYAILQIVLQFLGIDSLTNAFENVKAIKSGAPQL